MNIRSCKTSVALFVMMAFWIGSASLSMAQPPADHAVFQKMVGEWSAKGEIVLPGAEQPIQLSEQWQGAFDDEGSVVINGSRQLGEAEQTFTWTYYYNSSLELYEVSYRDSSSEEEKTFQVSANEDESSIEFQIPLEDSGNTLNMRKVVRADSIESVVTVLDANGGQAGGGTIVHTRKAEAKSDQ